MESNLTVNLIVFMGYCILTPCKSIKNLETGLAFTWPLVRHYQIQNIITQNRCQNEERNFRIVLSEKI